MAAQLGWMLMRTVAFTNQKGGSVKTASAVSVASFSRHRDLRILNVYDDNCEGRGGEVARLMAKNV